MAQVIERLSPERREVLGQLARFIVTGALVTALGVGVYALAALVLGWHPQLANILAYLAAMATGYVMHSRWSFRDHGTRSRSTSVTGGIAPGARSLPP